jgi:predicted nucleic acid-binding protein
MVYLDTSALVPLFVRESTSDRVQSALSSLATREPAVSDWVLLEFNSAIAARVRSGSLGPQEGREAIRKCEDLADASFVVCTIASEDIAAARLFVQDFPSGLRAADALHLAVAGRLSASLLTLDRVQARAARRLGLMVL